MMNYKELKRKEFLFEIIDDVIDGMDVYNHNGSLWLIKTEELKWAIEFTKDKTLWYNYNLFKNLFKAISLDVSENQKYITEWFESRFLKPEVVEDTIQNGVKHTTYCFETSNRRVGDTIQNGVKHTQGDQQPFHIDVEDTIENGVRDISPMTQYTDWQVEEIIENGVKHTSELDCQSKGVVENTIQNGVKEIKTNKFYANGQVEGIIKNGVKETISTLRRTLLGVDDIIQNGVKEIRSNKGLITSYRQNHKAKETIENGVMNTKPMDEWVNAESIIENTIEYGVKETHEDVYHHRPRICGVIKNGVKEVQPLPAQDGNRDWGNYYFGKQDRTKPFNDYLNDAIKYGKKI